MSEFNARFGVVPRSEADLHKKITQKETDGFPSIFCRHYERTIRSDYTLSYQNNWYQLEETQAVAIFKKDVVKVEERFDGEIRFKLRGKYLVYRQLPERPRKVSEKAVPWVLVKSLPARPAIDHPWRSFQYANN